MAVTLLKHVLSLRIALRCLHNTLSGPGADELLHLDKALVNSSFENQVQGAEGKVLSLFKTSFSIIQC